MLYTSERETPFQKNRKNSQSGLCLYICDEMPQYPVNCLVDLASSSQLMPLSVVKRLIEAMRNSDDKNVMDESLEGYESLLNLVYTPLYSNNETLFNGVIWSNLRRLSRETTLTCYSYTKLAFFLATCIEKLNIKTILFKNFQNCDSASFIVILRLLTHFQNQDLEIVLQFEQLEISSKFINKMRCVEYSSVREEMFGNFLKNIPDAVTVYFSLLNKDKKEPDDIQNFANGFAQLNASLPTPFSFDDGVKKLQTYTSFLMYDCAYLYAEAILDITDLDSQNWFIREVQILLDLNTKNSQVALEKIDKLLECDLSPVQEARYCYLKGVISIKRKMALSEAFSSFYNGLDILRSSCSASSLIELGWLSNGIGLSYALQSKDNQQKKREFLELALQWENHAINMISSLNNSESRYLTHNILTNISTAYEMLGNYKKAIEIWDKFTDLVSDSKSLPKFNLLYRKGILEWYEGDTEKATLNIESALTTLHTMRPFDLATCSWIYYALAYIHAREKHSQDSERNLSSALEAATRVNDKVVLELCNRLANLLKAKSDDKIWRKYQGLFPPSKLPSYYSYIDLANTPDFDFNRLLRSVGEYQSRVLVPTAK